MATALGVSIEEVERKIARDPPCAELIAFRKEQRQAGLEKRLDNILEGFVDELEHAVDGGSAQGLGCMLREIRLGLRLAGLTVSAVGAARASAPFDWDTRRPDDDLGGPDRYGTPMERFLASLCDLNYEEWRSKGESPSGLVPDSGVGASAGHGA
jgi:hypothetical protein